MSIKGILKICLMTHDSGMCKRNQKWIKMRMKTPIHFDNNGNEVIIWCSFGVGLCFFLNNDYHACVVIINAPCTIFVWVGSIMTMYIKVWKSSLVIKMFTRHRVRWKKRWETSFWTCVLLSKAITTTVS